MQAKVIINPQGTDIQSRFSPPNGFARTVDREQSFGHYLRNLNLKPHGSFVKYYDGGIKQDYAYCAVVDLPIGDNDLQQCADAVIRLRADYLYEQKRYSDIHFNFTNGFKVDYIEWMKGNRIKINGSKSYWVKKKTPSNTRQEFWKYLETIFMYAGTYSLSKELESINMTELSIGDVFIFGGFPGHAVIVVDLAINSKTKKTIYLLAQSYMPAQELQILKNPNNSNMSPWYELKTEQEIVTPEWTFKTIDLKRFK